MASTATCSLFKAGIWRRLKCQVGFCVEVCEPGRESLEETLRDEDLL